LRTLEVDRSGDEHGSANVRHDETHVPSHLRVGDTIAFMPKDTEHRGACGRFVEDGGDTIDKLLWSRPFPIHPGFEELVVGDEVAGRDRLLDRRQDLTGR